MLIEIYEAIVDQRHVAELRSIALASSVSSLNIDLPVGDPNSERTPDCVAWSAIA